MYTTFFKKLKVIELASVLAGPAVGMFFAELGAEVIKIENKKTEGDVTRGWRLPNEDIERAYSAYYSSVNYGKKSLMLDLRQLEDQQVLFDHVKTADIIIANYRPGSAQKLGVDYDSLKAIKPDLIYANLTSFGPNSRRPAFDIVLQAETGFLYMTGEPNRDPVRMPVALIDVLAAHQLKEGVLIALLKRAQTGEGSYIETSLFESAIASLANQASNYLMEGFVPQRMGTQHPNIAPYGDLFKTLDDKLIVLAVGTENQFKELCKVLSLEQLVDDKRYSTNAVRVQNRSSLVDILTPSIASFQSEQLLELFVKASVPAGLVRDMQSVFDQPLAEAMILEQKEADGIISKRVKTVGF